MNCAAANNRALTWACYLAMFVFGTVFTMLGAILPLWLETRGLNVAEAGGLFFFLSLGALVAVLATGPFVDRTGYKMTFLVAPPLIAVALFLLRSSASYAATALACALMGLGGGALNNATNSFTSDLHPTDRAVALNRLGVFFSLGALFIPLLMGTFLRVLEIGPVLWIATAVALLPAVAFSFQTFPAAKQTRRVPLGSMLGMLANPLVLLLSLLLFLQSGIELSSSGWISTFFTTSRGLTTREASWILALLWVGVMVSRLLAGLWLKRIPEMLVIFLSAFGAALAWLLLLHSRVLALEVVAVFLLGFCLAGIFPTALAIAGTRFPQNSGAVFGALFAVATLGGMTIPAAIGHVALTRGMVAGMSILPLCCALVCILSRRVATALARR